MTADWRATLERVAEKLASAKERPTIVLVDQDLDEALALIRGLLAEPQPDECPRCHGNGAVMDLPGDVDLCPSCDGSGLAEPQVNPSEAKATGRPANEIERLEAIVETQGYEIERLRGVLHARAGLLAEGEESREP